MGLVSDPLVRGPGISSPLRESRNDLGGKAGLDFLLVHIFRINNLKRKEG